MKPNLVGPKVLFLNPTLTNFNTAELAAIDSIASSSAASHLPYAYSATVRDDYDTMKISTADAGQVLVAGQRVAFGLFLSAQNDLSGANAAASFLFQLSSYMNLIQDTGTQNLRVRHFFGRRATSNTVVSSKAGANNALASVLYVPQRLVMGQFTTGFPAQMEACVESELFALGLAGGFVWCFGCMIDNEGGADATIQFDLNISFRKYSTVIRPYQPAFAG